ncbi:hypothetical protein [Parabacteroides distasonis]|jgi:hypothetical protein B2_04775|uniref:hypothetical protein n=1 Tax=Parabacteroides distasonis TaxID=823 RepID=UPI0039B486B0
MIKNTIEDILSKYVGGKIDIANEQKSISMQRRKVFSSIITDSFYVLDIVQKQFIYIKPDDLFLCGHSVKEAMELGYDFFSRVIHPEDLPLWKIFLENLPQKNAIFARKQDCARSFFLPVSVVTKIFFPKRAC